MHSDTTTRAKMEFFHREDAPQLFDSEIMKGIVYPPELKDFLGQFDFKKLNTGADARVLFRQPWEGGFSLVYVHFGPDYILTRHSHDTDCTYYIIRGEVHFGRERILKAGDGFFVPAEHPYGYTMGPEGVEILEFRHAASFGSRVVEKNEAIWESIFRVADSHQDSWRAVVPQRTSGRNQPPVAPTIAAGDA